MKKTFKLLTLFVLAALLLLSTSPAHAQGPNPDSGGQVIFGNNFTLKSGETFEGDLVVFGGNVTIEEDASLGGDLVVIGGTIESNGEMQGDVVVVGGQVSLEESARVAGDVVTIGSQLQRAEGAQIEGEVVNNVAPNITFPSGRIPPTAPVVPNLPDIGQPNINLHYNPFAEVFWIFFWAVVVSGFAMLLALFWQPQIERAGQAIITQPVMTGAIGLLSFVIGAVFFFTLLPLIVIPLAWLFGVVAMGQEVGERFTKAINQVWSQVLTIGFGTFLLMLVGGAIGLIPCLGGIVLFMLGMVGIGASVMTLLGTRPVQVPAMTVYRPPTDSGQVPPAA